MRNEENIFLEKLGWYAVPLMKDGITFGELKKCFSEHKLNLEMDKSNFAWVMSESLLGEIEKAMPKLLKIAEKPRSFYEHFPPKLFRYVSLQMNVVSRLFLIV